MVTRVGGPLRAIGGARARHALTAASTLALVGFGCGKTSAGPGDGAAPLASASPAPRVMPPVGADTDQLLPAAPPGFTACTRDIFGPRIDEKTAAERTAAWQAEAKSVRPTLHRADVRAAFGRRDDDTTPEEARPEGVVRFTVPKGVLEMRFPGRLSTIRTASRAAQPQFERTNLMDQARAFRVAPLPADSRVMIGDGWIYRRTDGITPGFEVDVFLVNEGADETTQTLTRHIGHALEATTCSIAEGPAQRGAYRATSAIEPDGSASILVAGTAGGPCTPQARWEELVVVRRVSDVTVVLACRLAGEGSQALCKNALGSARLQ